MAFAQRNPLTETTGFHQRSLAAAPISSMASRLVNALLLDQKPNLVPQESYPHPVNFKVLKYDVFDLRPSKHCENVMKQL